MRFLVIAFAVVAAVGAATLPADYLPPVDDNNLTRLQEYLPPTADVVEDQTAVADDGYRYKAVRRLKFRHRRDVNELPQNEYLPPAEEIQETVVVNAAEIPAVDEQTELAHDGYRYKVVRRLKYRKRRDVDEIPQTEYLPPTQETEENVLVETAKPVAEDSTQLADDGYRYKAVRRLKYRKRRDVDEIPENEYIPPAEETQQTVVVEAVDSAPEEQTKLADDGYRYKTIRRLKYRKRRDVNEPPQNEYIPAIQETQESVVVEAAEPTAEPTAVVEEKTQLADDGYRYKVVRRLKYRTRRDVDEIPENEYLPPTEEAEQTIVVEAAAPAAEEQTKLANDGYRYKTVRRLKYRKRRDVNELPPNEYLPPVQDAQETIVTEHAEPAAEVQTELADDGYRYKTVRRLKYRRRRDVNEIPQNEYLPPTEYLPPAAAEAQETVLAKAVESTAEEQNELADDGYRYKVVRRLKYRKRRDVNEIPPQSQYLPPAEEAQETAVAELSEAAPEDATVLTNDGYRYKVVRRLKYRQRRDVNELPANEYLPPTEEGQEEPEEKTATRADDDGYRYKTVRRLKYRRH